MTRTVYMEGGDLRRMSLPKPIWQGREEYGTGMTLRAIYCGPRTRRVIVETYSIWQDGQSQRIVGTSYHEADAEERARLAAIVPSCAAALDSAYPPEEV